MDDCIFLVWLADNEIHGKIAVVVLLKLPLESNWTNNFSPSLNKDRNRVIAVGLFVSDPTAILMVFRYIPYSVFNSKKVNSKMKKFEPPDCMECIDYRTLGAHGPAILSDSF